MSKCADRNPISVEEKQKLNQKKKKDFTKQARMIGNQHFVYMGARKIINQVNVKELPN